MNATARAERYHAVVGALSEDIAEALHANETERAMPGSDPDRMDDKIKFTGERARVLRRLREEYENEMARQVAY